MKKRAWIIPANTAILFAVLCFWAIETHDTLAAVICVILCLLNLYFTYRWLKMQRMRRS